MTELSTYLKSTGQTQSAFAKQLGISQNYLSEISRFLKKPSGDLAYEIEKATNGAIPMSYWFSPRDAGQTSSHAAITKSSENKEVPHGRLTDRG